MVGAANASDGTQCAKLIKNQSLILRFCSVRELTRPLSASTRGRDSIIEIIWGNFEQTELSSGDRLHDCGTAKLSDVLYCVLRVK